MMAEASARISEDAIDDVQNPGEGALPFSAGLRAGVRQGWVTVRTFLGAGAGGHSAHVVPLRAQAAILAQCGRKGRLGFAGLEVDADWAQRTPVTIAPDLVLRGAPPLRPFRAFGLSSGYPRLAFNSLTTESQRNEHIGLMNTGDQGSRWCSATGGR